MFFTLPLMPMRVSEENELLRAAGASSVVAETLVRFAGVYRKSLAEEPTPRRRRLGTRALVRIARRMAATAITTSSIAGADLHALLSRAVLAEFLPATERMNLESLFEDCDIVPQATPVRHLDSMRVGS
jgi:von Willebrand factor A domain-containing protein 8